MTVQELRAQVMGSPYAYAQYVIDQYYPAVLNNAFGAKLVQGDVGPEALYNVVANLIEGGHRQLAALVLNVVPANNDAIVGALAGQSLRSTTATDGQPSWWDQNGDSVVQAAGSLAGLFAQLFGNDEPATPTATNQPAPAPVVVESGMSTQTIIIIAVVAVLVGGGIYLATRK
jgi:hypothetical protein